MDKDVHYFLVEAVGGVTKAQAEEMKAVEWHEPEAAWERGKGSLYANNVPILQKALAMLALNFTI
ncbi:hypothetical protein D3C76_1837360 [compost metagenome]